MPQKHIYYYTPTLFPKLTCLFPTKLSFAPTVNTIPSVCLLPQHTHTHTSNQSHVFCCTILFSLGAFFLCRVYGSIFFLLIQIFSLIIHSRTAWSNMICLPFFSPLFCSCVAACSLCTRGFLFFSLLFRSPPLTVRLGLFCCCWFFFFFFFFFSVTS